jgi:hypothetical protein
MEILNSNAILKLKAKLWACPCAALGSGYRLSPAAPSALSLTQAPHRQYIDFLFHNALRMLHACATLQANTPIPSTSQKTALSQGLLKTKNGPLHLRSIQPSMRSMENAHF